MDNPLRPNERRYVAGVGIKVQTKEEKELGGEEKEGDEGEEEEARLRVEGEEERG